MTRAQLSDVDRALGQNVRVVRQAARFTRRDLAERLDCSWQQLQKYEMGENRVTASMLIRIAHALGVSTRWLLPDEAIERADKGSAHIARVAKLAYALSDLEDAIIIDLLDKVFEVHGTTD